MPFCLAIIQCAYLDLDLGGRRGGGGSGMGMGTGRG